MDDFEGERRQFRCLLAIFNNYSGGLMQAALYLSRLHTNFFHAFLDHLHRAELEERSQEVAALTQALAEREGELRAAQTAAGSALLAPPFFARFSG